MSYYWEKTRPERTLGPVIIEPAGVHTSSVIFLHDLGSTGHSWSSLAMLTPPGMGIVCPTAPVIEISMSANAQVNAWFDLKTLDIDGPEDEEGIQKSAEIVHMQIDAEIEKGIPSNRIVLGGYSQGGALALFAALTYNKPLAGIVALSSWLPMRQQFPRLKKLPDEVPIFMAHGIYDLVVLHKYGEASADHIMKFMDNVEFKTYDSLSHMTCEDELFDVKNMLEKWVK